MEWSINLEQKKTQKSKFRWWSLLISVLFVAVALGITMYFTNVSYFKNEPNYVNLPFTDITVKDDSNGDVEYAVRDLNKYVKSIKLVGNVTAGPEEFSVYYTSPKSEAGAEANRLEGVATLVDDGIIIEIDRKVGSIAILFSEDRFNQNTDIQSFQIDTTHFEIQIQVILVGILIAILASLPFYYDYSVFGKLLNYAKNSKNYAYLLQNLVSRDITTKYRRSVLGILWSVLNPLLMMLVITMVFQHVFRSDIENFPIYYLTGSLIFNFVVEATNGAMMSILGASSLIKKVYIPKYIFPLEKTIFALVNMLFSLIAVVIIMFFQRFVPSWTIILIPIPILYTFIFCIGLGLILASLNVFFRDISHLWGVFTTAWLYLTPIIYPMNSLPNAVQQIVKLNPLYYYVDYFRQIVMYGTVPNLTTNAVCIFLSLTFLAFGIIIFKKTQDKFILHI